MAWTTFGRPVRPDHGSSMLVVGDVVFDPATGWVAVGGWLVRTPGREAQLLEQLMRNPGKVLTVDVLASSAQIDLDRVGRLARRLRRRLMVDPLRPPLIEVINGSDYRFLAVCAVEAAEPPA